MFQNISRSLLMVIAFFAIIFSPSQFTQAATLPAGFVETIYAQGISQPTTMQFAPDGRLFVAEQTGGLRVVKNGSLLPVPFIDLSVDSTQERGLLGIAFDPNFAENQYIYLYYTTNTAPIHNRVSRFTANGDLTVPGSEQIIFELDNLSSATNHNGGALHFGPDGKLYIAVGDNANGANAQSLETTLGKILRINSDGSIPTDNPFYGDTTGNNRAIWAYGLRNPFNFAFQPGTGLMYLNDVGQNTWEEINEGIIGTNYGWPNTEGETSNPAYKTPVYVYDHGSNGGCSIVGATFYNPASSRFPADYAGDYFFGDLCSAWIRRIDPVTKQVTGFATSTTGGLVDVTVSTDGYLYYLARGGGNDTGVVYRVDYTVNEAEWLSPKGTLTDTIGNPTYSWQVTPGAGSYEVYVGATDNNGNILYTAFWNTVAGSNCDETTCSIDLTSLSSSAWLANGSYSAYFKPDNGDWKGPFTFAINAQAPTVPVLSITSTNALKPTLNWTLNAESGRAAWFQIYLAPSDNLAASALPVPTWVTRLDACGSWVATDCSYNVSNDLADNNYYSFYLQSWGAGGFSTGGNVDGAEGWGLYEFPVGSPAPRLATDLAVQINGGSPIFTWTAPAFADSYQIWIGTIEGGIGNQAYFETHTAESIGCGAGGTCTLTPPLSAPLSAGEYYWYVKASGPGGESTSGTLAGWAEPTPPTFEVN